ncbi:MAG: hypothetical protein LQ341_005343 [Variospora aurantia]|nr:MAG: hypothetical protein LQ341_005343 [Variospora aurantia]
MPQLKWSLICSLLLASQITVASQFSPRGDIEQRYGTNLERRITCQPATPDVNEDAVFTDACNENPQNNFNDCFNSLVLYAQDSALSTCGRFYALYNNCLVNNNYSETACADARTGYVYCSNYTIQAYAYCGCYFALPTQLYNCANVELEVRNRDYFAPAPTSTLLTSAILTGPVAPSSATLSSIPQSVAATAPPAPVFSPRQSSTLLISTAFITSTVITTSCSSGVSSCAATTYSSAFVSESSVWTCGSAGCVIPPSSLPPVTVTGTPIATVVTPSSTSLAVATTATTPKVRVGCESHRVPIRGCANGMRQQQSTSTILTTVPVTRTSTITSCPAALTPCPSAYSSESVYTTTTVRTVLSCDGGCDAGPSREGECVLRTRAKIFSKRSEL